MKKQWSKELGRRLCEARRGKGLTQEDAARQIEGLTFSALSNYERGVRDPDTDLVARLADLYGVSADYLFGFSEHPGRLQLPPYTAELSPELRSFLEREAETGWPRLRLLYDADLAGLTSAQLEQVLSVLVDLKKREEQGEKDGK